MINEPDHKPPQIIIYETDDQVARVSVRLEDETVWLTQQQVSDLYGTSRPNVTMHIKNIFSDGELNEDAVCKKCLQTAADGKNYEVLFYNLDMIPQVSGQNAQRRGKAISCQPQKRRNRCKKERQEMTFSTLDIGRKRLKKQ